jgi:hypothetical protein
VTAWLSAEEQQRLRRSRRRRGDQQATLRSLTIVAAVAATALNGLLFAQSGLGSISAGDVENAIVDLIGAVLPGGAGSIRPAASPTPADGGTPVVVSGGS